MRLKYFVVLLIFAFGSACPAFANEEVKVTTLLDKKTLEVNDQLNLTIKITGSRVNIERPRIPISDSFESFYSGRASRFTLMNGKQETVTEFRYVLVPRRPGVFTVGPVEITVNETTFRTDPVKIEVLGTPGQAFVSPGAQTGVSGPFPSGAAPVTAPVPRRAPQPVASSQASQAAQPDYVGGEGGEIFLRAWVSKTDVYPGEQILLNYSIYTRADTRYEGFDEEPQATGFWIEEFPIGQNIQPTTVSVRGRKYVKADIKKMALFATSPGTFEIRPGSVKASIEETARSSGMFDDFFSDSFFGGGGLFARRVNKILTAPVITINVKELPARGRPSEFSGTVGRFNFTSSIDKREVKQNEPITMTLAIEGEGNIETLEHPQIPDLENFKIYEGESASQLYKRGETIVGSKNFEAVFIPERAGDFALPSLVFNYFDPVEQVYKAIRTPEHKVKVLPGQASEELKYIPAQKTEDLKKEVTKETKDIYTIKTSLGLARENQRKLILRDALLWTDAGLGLGFLVFFLARARSEVYKRDSALRRRKFASRVARKRHRKLLRSVEKSPQKVQREFFVEACEILDQYFSDKFGLSPLGLTFSDVEPFLTGSDLEEVLLEEIRQFYETSDLVKFTSHEAKRERLVEMLHLIEKMILELEKRR